MRPYSVRAFYAMRKAYTGRCRKSFEVVCLTVHDNGTGNGAEESEDLLYVKSCVDSKRWTLKGLLKRMKRKALVTLARKNAAGYKDDNFGGD